MADDRNVRAKRKNRTRVTAQPLDIKRKLDPLLDALLETNANEGRDIPEIIVDMLDTMQDVILKLEKHGKIGTKDTLKLLESAYIFSAYALVYQQGVVDRCSKKIEDDTEQDALCSDTQLKLF